MATIGVNGPKLADLDYRVVRSVGSGAGSTVLLVADKNLGSQYALKIVKRQSADDDIYINQAIHEFEVAGRLNHPSLLKIHDCRTRRSWFRVTGVELLEEFVDGKTLDEHGKLELGPLVIAFIHVASALKHMHRRGIYHADLKPGNIMLSRKGEVKVIDFGTAWIKGQPKDRVQGTPQYMAPESAKDKVIDEKTDLYNFGATMYRMFTGQYANLGGMPGMDSVALGRCFRPKPPMEHNPEIPGTLNEAIMACLEPNPDRRPAGVFEVKHQLVAVARYLRLKVADLEAAAD
jgi:serine/threonine-protein kinase